MSARDRDHREQICYVGKLLYDKGLIVGTEGNISCLTAEGEILITPAGKCKGMLKPEEIVLLSPSGETIDGQQTRSSECRLHLFGYKHRSDFRAAVHAHPPYVTAFAVGGLNLDVKELPEFAATFGIIPYIPFADPGSQALAERLGDHIGHHHTFLLENHGIISFGADLMEAFFRVEMAEQIAKTIAISRTLVDVSLLYEEGAFADDDEVFRDDLDSSRIQPIPLRKSSKRRKK